MVAVKEGGDLVEQINRLNCSLLCLSLDCGDFQHPCLVVMLIELVRPGMDHLIPNHACDKAGSEPARDWEPSERVGHWADEGSSGADLLFGRKKEGTSYFRWCDTFANQTSE